MMGSVTMIVRNRLPWGDNGAMLQLSLWQDVNCV